MKLYNKIFSLFFLHFFYFSSEVAGKFLVKMLTYPKGSEAEMFSDKSEIHMLLTEFEEHPFDEFIQFSSPIDSEKRIDFDESFGKDLDLMIEANDFTSDYPLIQADFHKINLNRNNQIGLLSIDKKSGTFEFRN